MITKTDENQIYAANEQASSEGAAENRQPTNQKVDEAYAHYIEQMNNSRVDPNARTFLAVLLGSLIMAVNVNTFIQQGGLLPGGANGLTILFQRLMARFFGIAVPYTPVSFCINAVPAYLAFKTVGRKFTLFSCLYIVLMSLLTDLIPVHALIYDPLLIAVFGGLINGFGICLLLNAGASSGGTDFVAMYLSAKKGISTWNYVLILNAVIILTSGLIFGLESALYSLIFQFAQTQMLNTFYKRYRKKTIFVITDHPHEVASQIMEHAHHSATVFQAEGAYTERTHSVVYSILSADEAQRVCRSIRVADPRAFINLMNSESVIGNFYHRPIA